MKKQPQHNYTSPILNWLTAPVSPPMIHAAEIQGKSDWEKFEQDGKPRLNPFGSPELISAWRRGWNKG